MPAPFIVKGRVRAGDLHMTITRADGTVEHRVEPAYMTIGAFLRLLFGKVARRG